MLKTERTNTARKLKILHKEHATAGGSVSARLCFIRFSKTPPPPRRWDSTWNKSEYCCLRFSVLVANFVVAHPALARTDKNPSRPTPHQLGRFVNTPLERSDRAHLPVRLRVRLRPNHDPTFDSSLSRGLGTGFGITDFHDVTGRCVQRPGNVFTTALLICDY